MGRTRRGAWASLLCWVALVVPSGADIAVSGNGGKVTSDAGIQVVPPEIVPDTVSVIDLSASPPRVVGEVEAPASVVGPPLSVAVAPDESFALVTAAQKVDPADPRKYAPDNRHNVVDLKASPPKVVATHTVGAGAAGVTLNRAGTLALVANRGQRTVSVFSVREGTLTERDLFAGIRPYVIHITGDGRFAAIATLGMGMGDADTVSLVDLRADPSRVVTTVTVGQTPEGLTMSPDGAFLAVGVINGSNKAENSPFDSDHGLLRVYHITDHALAQVAEAQTGHWCRGVAWSRDGRTLVTQCMIEREIRSFAVDGASLEPTGAIMMKNGPAGIRTAEP